MSFRNGEYSWHVWHKDPVTNVRKYCGAFFGAEDALTWKKAQESPEDYKVTNFGPIAEANPRPVRGPEQKPAKKTATDIRAAERAAQREAERKRHQNRKPAVVQQPETADQKKMKADAKDLMEKHKADEAADLKAGINR